MARQMKLAPNNAPPQQSMPRKWDGSVALTFSGAVLEADDTYLLDIYPQKPCCLCFKTMCCGGLDLEMHFTKANNYTKTGEDRFEGAMTLEKQTGGCCGTDPWISRENNKVASIHLPTCWDRACCGRRQPMLVVRNASGDTSMSLQTSTTCFQFCRRLLECCCICCCPSYQNELQTNFFKTKLVQVTSQPVWRGGDILGTMHVANMLMPSPWSFCSLNLTTENQLKTWFEPAEGYAPDSEDVAALVLLMSEYRRPYLQKKVRADSTLQLQLTQPETSGDFNYHEAGVTYITVQEAIASGIFDTHMAAYNKLRAAVGQAIANGKQFVHAAAKEYRLVDDGSGSGSD